MKKVIACITIAVLLTTALCGCGNYGDARDNGTYPSVERPAETATITPDMSTDADDGIVTDRDGVIEDNETAGNTQGTAGMNNGTSGNAGSAASSNSTGSSGTSGNNSGNSNGNSTSAPTHTSKP